MVSRFTILLSIASSLWALGSTSPVLPTLEANAVAPTATPARSNGGHGETAAHRALIPKTFGSAPANTFPFHAAITGTPTHYPTKITNIATVTESYERTDANPVGGEGYIIRTDITIKTQSTIEEWSARVTSLPYQVKGSVEETTMFTANITEYWTGTPPRPFVTGGTVTDSPYASHTLLLTATNIRAGTPRVVDFSLTSFPTSFTKTYTSTSIYTISGLPTTNVIVETITESWSAQPTSLPYTLKQRAVARTWRGSLSYPVGLRTYEPRFTVGSLPTSESLARPRLADHEVPINQAAAALAKRYQHNSITPLAYAFTTLPTNLPTTMTASSTSALTSSYTFVNLNAFAGAMNYSIDITSQLFETQYEVQRSAPTGFPFSVTGSVVGTTISSSTLYKFPYTMPPMYPCGETTAPTWCPTIPPPTPGTPTETSTFSGTVTNTWSWVKVYHFSFTEGTFPTTVTKFYTSTVRVVDGSLGMGTGTVGGGPATSTSTRTDEPGPLTTSALLPLDGKLVYIDVSAIIETWASKPTSLPTTVTQTGTVTHLVEPEQGGRLLGWPTVLGVERVYVPMVVGSIKEGLGKPGNLSWEYLPFE